jgi:hypothetical protein
MSGEPVQLSDYLRLDDVALLHAFRVWESDPDPALARLTRQLSARELPKTLPLPADARVWQVAAERAREVAERHGHPPDLTIRLDVATEVTYGEPDDESPEGLWVSIRHRPMTRLGRISFVLGELRNKSVERPRLIFPAAIRDELLASLQDVIGGDAGSGR